MNKKRFLNLFSMMVLFVTVGLLNVSCGDEPVETQLAVNPTSISLTAQVGAASSFSITTNTTWTATCTEAWINLSSRSGGNGTSTITVTSVEENKTGETRSATIVINAGTKSASIVVEQLSDVKALKMSVSEVLTLTTSAAYKLTQTGDVSYYYGGYLSASAAGWSDDKILEELQKGEAIKPSATTVYGISNLSANTEYYYCTVAYDSAGKRGPVEKKLFKTAAFFNNRPDVSYTSLTYTTSQWKWSTEIGPYASKYYMIALAGNAAWQIYAYSDALVAWIIRDGINDNSLSPIVQNGNWSKPRYSGEDFFYSAAWATDSNGKFANEIDYATKYASSAAKQAVPMEKKNIMNLEEVKKLPITLIAQ